MPYAAAALGLGDLALQRGYGVFDFFRTVGGRPLFADAHLSRLAASAQALHLPLPLAPAALLEVCTSLVQQSGLQEAGIRIMVTGGYAEDGYTPTRPNLIITCTPVRTAGMADFEKGVSIQTYAHRRELPQVKSINYLTAVWLRPWLQQQGADEVLYHQEGIVSEFPRANLLVVDANQRLLTPAADVLAGVTCRYLCNKAAADGLEVVFTDISIDEVTSATEVMLTSTTRKVLPVLRVNNQIIGSGTPGPVARRLWRYLQAAAQAAAEGNLLK